MKKNGQFLNVRVEYGFGAVCVLCTHVSVFMNKMGDSRSGLDMTVMLVCVSTRHMPAR